MRRCEPRCRLRAGSRRHRRGFAQRRVESRDSNTPQRRNAPRCRTRDPGQSSSKAGTGGELRAGSVETEGILPSFEGETPSIPGTRDQQNGPTLRSVVARTTELRAFRPPTIIDRPGEHGPTEPLQRIRGYCRSEPPQVRGRARRLTSIRFPYACGNVQAKIIIYVEQLVGLNKSQYSPFVSTNAATGMDFVSWQPISGAERVDVVQRFVPETLEPLELGLFSRPANQEITHYGGHRGIAFGRLDASAAMDVVVDDDCDIFPVHSPT